MYFFHRLLLCYAEVKSGMFPLTTAWPLYSEVARSVYMYMYAFQLWVDCIHVKIQFFVFVWRYCSTWHCCPIPVFVCEVLSRLWGTLPSVSSVPNLYGTPNSILYGIVLYFYVIELFCVWLVTGRWLVCLPVCAILFALTDIGSGFGASLTI